jgi:ABC-type histidine transport system ATPase subunit
VHGAAADLFDEPTSALDEMFRVLNVMTDLARGDGDDLRDP